jgi:hypothetical protein
MRTLHYSSEPIRWLFALAVSLAAIHDGVGALSQELMDARRGLITPIDGAYLLVAALEMIACFGIFSRSPSYRLVSSSVLLLVFATDRLSATGDTVPFWGVMFCSLLAMDAWRLKSATPVANGVEVPGASAGF